MSTQYKVGYGRPPQATRFKRGRSGNPKGRPKGSLNLATDLAAELGESITVREDGRPRRISKQRALIKSLMAKALQGDARASATLLGLYGRLITEPPEDQNQPLEQDELLILRRFGPRLLKALAKKGKWPVKPERELFDLLCRREFGAFVEKAFEAVYPGRRISPSWHIEAICYLIQQIVEGVSGKRLVLNLPPRTLKSFITSVALPAWLLGRDPGARIMCASYGEDLAFKFSRDCRALMESPFYKRVFPTRLNPRKTTEAELETTRRGFRLATSVGGTLTGRGGMFLIVDDPLKANDAESEVARTNAVNWFHNTAMSRLDEPAESLILVTMQRLHAEDLSGVLIEKGWPKLVLPAIATEPASYARGDGETYDRQPGEVLQPSRDSLKALEEQKREMGSRIFAAQYQQDPTPPDGNKIKFAWLTRYEEPQLESYQRIILTCDPAGKAGPRNDYTAITVVGIQPKALHILHVTRGHWTVLEMRRRIVALAAEWAVDLVIVEDTASGMSLIPFLKERSSLNVIGRSPKEDKVTRLSHHEGRFEAGRIVLPQEAPWLADFERELLAFPYGRHDDQLDALLLALDWYAEREPSLQPLDIIIDVDSFWRPSPWRLGDDTEGL